MATYDNTPPVAATIAGLSRPVVVKAAPVGNVTLPGIGTTIDGITVSASAARILLKAQTDPVENGIYAHSGAGVWARDAAFNGLGETPSGLEVTVEGGSTNAGKLYRITTADPITPGTTAVTYALQDRAGIAKPATLAGLTYDNTPPGTFTP